MTLHRNTGRIGRRLFAVSALTAGAGVAMTSRAHAGEPARDRNVTRAESAFAAMQEHFAAGDGLFQEQVPVQPGDRPYSFEWPHSQALIAAADLTGIDGRRRHHYTDAVAEIARGQEAYWNAGGGTTGLPGYDSYVRAPYGGGGDMFYDDNEWVGLLDVQRYLQVHDMAALARAKQIFDLVVSGWDDDPTHPSPGGVFWTQATWSTDRNTVSTMPGAELGLRLHQVTGERRYLDWAMKLYDWTVAVLLAPNGLFWDHIALDGSINTMQWTYNQGVPIGVNVALHRATGERRYLDRARGIASAALDHFVLGDNLDGQPMYFNSIYFKNMLLLESVDHDPRYRQTMQAYADAMWEGRRDPGTGLFHPTDSDRTQLLEQAAMVQIFATLAWPPGRTRILY